MEVLNKAKNKNQLGNPQKKYSLCPAPNQLN